MDLINLPIAVSECWIVLVKLDEMVVDSDSLRGFMECESFACGLIECWIDMMPKKTGRQETLEL